MKKLLLFLVALVSTCAEPAFAQLVSSSAQQIQGTNATNRGYPVNVVTTDGAGNIVNSGTPTGTAGTPSTSVVSVQGVASGTVLPISAASLPLPTGAATNAAQTTAQTNMGAPGDSACATDNGSCSLNALTQRNNQRLTTINTTLAGSLTITDGSGIASSITVDNATASNLNAQVVGTIASGSSDSGNPVKVGGRYNSTLPTLTDGLRGDLQVGTRGALSVQIMGVNSTAGAALTAGTADGNATGNIGLQTFSYGAVFNGTTWDRMYGTTAGAYAQGNVASAASDSGNPVKVGGRYNSSPIALTTGQRGDLQLGTAGALHVELWGPSSTATPPTVTTNAADGNGAAGTTGLTTNSFGYVLNSAGTWDRLRGDVNGAVVQPAFSSTFWNYAAASGGIVNTTTAVTIKAAAGAGIRNYLCTLEYEHDPLGGQTEWAVRDGAAGTVLVRGRLLVNGVETKTITFSPCLRGSANTLMEFVTLTATITGGVYVNAQGFTGN